MTLPPDSRQDLIDRLTYIHIRPKTVLLFGDFSPEEQQKIQKIYPKALLKTGLDQGPFDVILGLGLPGEREVFEGIFESFKQSLNPGGMLLFNQFGLDYAAGFPDMHDIGDLLLQLGFENPVVDTEFKMIFGHAWAKQSQETHADGTVKSVRVSLDRLLDSLKRPFRR